jgi:LysR family cyn operon transcriptional activator
MSSIKTGTTEIRHLRYFMAVVEAGHFRKAAATLHISQPNLSHQIRQLELQMGAPLLERFTRGLRLTAAGQIIYQQALAILRKLADAHHAISELNALQRGSLRVGIVSTINVTMVPEAVCRFHKQYPKVSVSIRELSMTALETELLAGKLDFGISLVPGASGDRLESELLFEERLVAVVSKTHPLAKRKQVRLAKVLDHPLALLSSGFCTRELVDQSIAGLKLANALNPAIEMNSIEGVLAAVRQMDLVTLLPDAAVPWSNYPELSKIPLDPKGLSFRRVGFLWVAGGHRTAAALAFAQEVKSIASARGLSATGNPKHRSPAKIPRA